ncbi:spore gernimation protein GerPD [Paenibacillus sp. UNC451MF]|uniref:spore gernimation protein GerPD n=1 Tax=Paenibacillus sp. UNC451MF TaxID=1449063 RepID=UPI0009E0840D|nr:spore gernimation protein GerPD [Paenibacillus sp. UNC451MF]
MNFQVVNKGLCVGEIRVIGVSVSSVLLIGDTEQIVLSSISDTPPESVTTGPLVPLASEE